MTKYKFNCGCYVNLIDSSIKDDNLPSLQIPYDDIIRELNYTIGCKPTWEMLGEGKSKGVFQLEKNHGKTWSEKLKPTSLEEMSALISLLRPGCINVIMDGKSMTQHYVDRKFDKEDAKSRFDALEPVLNDTYQVLTYQEQVIRICRDIAGFSETESDLMRKAMGKKKADLMASLKDSFVDGCDKAGFVTRKEGEEIFEWIKESNRYLFNKCLSPYTLVKKQDGSLVTLDEICIGDRILAPTGDGNNDEFVDVVNKYDNGYKELYEITLESGKTIQCTLSHKFLCEDMIIRSLEEIISQNIRIMCEDD